MAKGCDETNRKFHSNWNNPSASCRGSIRLDGEMKHTLNGNWFNSFQTDDLAAKLLYMDGGQQSLLHETGHKMRMRKIGFGNTSVTSVSELCAEISEY